MLSRGLPVQFGPGAPYFRKMRIIVKILVIFLIIFVLLLVSSYLILSIRGREIIEQQLSKTIDAPVSLENISLGFPDTIKIENLEIKDFLKTSLKLKLNPLGLFSGKVILNNITIDKPQLVLRRENDGSLKIPFKRQAGTASPKQLPIILGLDIRDGHVFFIDSSQDDYRLNIYDLDVKVHKRSIDLKPIFNFDVSAQLGEKAKNGKNFASEGWIDFFKKDMQGNLEIKDFYTDDILPIYNRLLGKNISGATLDFQAKMNAEDNDLKIDCHLLLSGIKTQEESGAEGKNHKDILVFSELLDIFSNPEGKIELDFVIHTKLDNPRFDKVDFGASLLKAAAKNILSKPQEEITSSVEEIGKDIKDWGKEKGKELLKTEGLKDIIDIFGK